ncbi:hypothetical protein ULMS_19510 [Patiriisocius marinistellae]|uniref:Amidohydrolase-related domain-containing protein n=1 Tax=Patiriisocius marinistellae TaxID=2494560 RepID=A0A5J4FWQ4_9FLAO|nr:hypothetical protein [Patiriisocius marinistellae]GEQ86443.1 hypothetical protein ULMS_19510 [Patiriisocius marinistellae]
MPKKPIINAHTHTFTSKFVPPFLAKTIVPWPLYFLIHTRWIVGLAQRYYRWKHGQTFPKYDKNKTKEEQEIEKQKAWDKIYASRRKMRSKTISKFNFKANRIIYIPWRIIIFWVSLVAFFYVAEFLGWIFGIDEGINDIFTKVKIWLTSYYLYFEFPVVWKVVWTLAVLIFINWSRRTIWFLIKKLFPFFQSILSPNGLALLERYLLMGRFSFYGTQKKVAERALDQLPPNSQMVILPMDMEFMGAGKSKMTNEILATKNNNIPKNPTEDDWKDSDYHDTFKYQMRELWDFVKTKRNGKNPNAYHPFLFLDPRRIEKEGNSFFSYTIVDGKMKLNDCYLKTYMEDRNFSGFKIYPALGYYVFDESLLPIWLYASQNNIPIMTHCVIGTIYFRGKKIKEWNYHPVFKQYYRDKRQPENQPEPMVLPQVKPVDLQYNFTHPMNYLCLLEETFLRELIGNAKDNNLKTLFGYTDKETPLTQTLKNIKICLAHYGGEEEWIKYLETDRDVYARSLIKNPNDGIDFMQNATNEFSWSKINSLWHDTDWYSLISSILMNYDNMYADLSYIISKPSIYPLLVETLRKSDNYEAQLVHYNAEQSNNKKASHFKGRNRLRSHILYGTDFYVVRNHNSDKDLYTETRAALDDESFDLIARENTFNYLSRD